MPALPRWLPVKPFGLEPSSARDAGTCTIFVFGFVRGHERETIEGVLSSMPTGTEIGVPDPSNGDCILEVRRSNAGLEAKRGCHGAAGTWRSVTNREALDWLHPGAVHASRTSKPGFGATLTDYNVTQ